jgi:hypothetical protein
VMPFHMNTKREVGDGEFHLKQVKDKHMV